MATFTILLTSPGAGVFTVPATAKSATIECWGGGGGSTPQLAGGGGAYARLNQQKLYPGETINYFVGNGGAGTTVMNSLAGVGQTTWFGSRMTVAAKGGATGPVSGGPAGWSVGDITFSGSNQATSYIGGASASPTGNGSGQASSGPDQGAGGPDSQPGGVPGGGGGYRRNGGRGQIRIIWTDEGEGATEPNNFPVSVVITATGDGEWTVPADCQFLDLVECWGGGGVFGSSAGQRNQSGGGGGAYSAIAKLVVTPGGTIPYRVGIGGSYSAGPSSSQNATSAETTWFGGRNIVAAKGGSTGNPGLAARSIGDFRASGGVPSTTTGSGSGNRLGDGGPLASVYAALAVSDEDGGCGGGDTNPQAGLGGLPGGGSGYQLNSGTRGQIRLTYRPGVPKPSDAKTLPFTKTVVIKNAGTGSWTPPTGVANATVELWGAGGSGGTTGAGGGAYVRLNNYTLNGAAIPYSVGSSNGDTWFGSTTTGLAKGGVQNGFGNAAQCVGDVKYSGAPRNGSGYVGGGSGNPWGSPTTYASVGSRQHTSDEDGGNGGADSGGLAGAPGGGGGYNGAGAPGQIRITYELPQPAPSTDLPTGGTLVTLPSSSTLYVASYDASYANARAGLGATISDYGWIGQHKPGSYEINQVMASFDLSSIPSGATITGARLTMAVAESYGSTVVEVRSHDWPTNATAFVPGDSLASKTLLANTMVAGSFIGNRQVLFTDLTLSNLSKIVLSSKDQRTGYATTSGELIRIEGVTLEVTYVGGSTRRSPRTGSIV